MLHVPFNIEQMSKSQDSLGLGLLWKNQSREAGLHTEGAWAEGGGGLRPQEVRHPASPEIPRKQAEAARGWAQQALGILGNLGEGACGMGV